MARLWCVVFASFILALLAAVIAVEDPNEHFNCSEHMNHSCACYDTGSSTGVLKLCLKWTKQTFVCSPCRKNNQIYLNCSECSISECPVCDNEGFRKWGVIYMDARPRKVHVYFHPPPERIFTPAPVNYTICDLLQTSSYLLPPTRKMRNISHSPLYIFKTDNCINFPKNLNETKIRSILRRLERMIQTIFSDLIEKQKPVKMENMSSNSQRLGEKRITDNLYEVLFKPYNAGLLSNKHEIYGKNHFNVLNSINNASPKLRFRREVEKTREDDLLGLKKDKAAEMPKEEFTTSAGHNYERWSTKINTVRDEAITKNFQTTRQPSTSKKHPSRVRGRKKKKFNKGNRKHKGNSKSFQAKFKNADHGEGSKLLDKRTTGVVTRFDKGSNNGTYGEFGEVNYTYITSKKDVPLSDISRDVSTVSFFSRFIGSTEVPNNLYNTQISQQAFQNSSDNDVEQLKFRNETILQEIRVNHKDGNTLIKQDLSNRIQEKQPTNTGKDLKLLATAGKENYLSSNVFRGLPRPNGTYSSGFTTDPDLSRKSHQALSTTSSSLHEQYSSPGATEYKVSGNNINGEQSSVNIANVSFEPPNQKGQAVNLQTTKEHENNDMESRNSRNLTYLSNHIPFTEKGENFRHEEFNLTNKIDTNNLTFLGGTSEHSVYRNKTKETNLNETLDDILEKNQRHTESNIFDGIKENIGIAESIEKSNRGSLNVNYSGNENETLSFSDETPIKSGERYQTVGYKRSHIVDNYTTMLNHVNNSELNRTSSKDSISDFVSNLDSIRLKDSEIQKNSSEHFIDDASTYSPFYYSTVKYDNSDYKNSTIVKHGNITIFLNHTIIKMDDNVENGMIESTNLESGHSSLRSKRDKLITEKVNKSLQYDRKNINGGFQNKKVLLNFTGDFSTPTSVMKQSSMHYNKDKGFHDPKKSDEVLRFDLNSSNHEKDQGLSFNETTKEVELDNKGILKFKNVRIKYKGKKFKGMGLNKKVEEFFAMPPNSNKDQKEQPKSMKVKLVSDGYSEITGNENLDVSRTSTRYDVKISDKVLGFDFNSSDQEKDQGLLNIETTKEVELDDKGILKFKNVRIKYKSQKFKGMGLKEKYDEFFAMAPNSNKDQKSKSMKVKLISDGYSEITGNENLDVSRTSTGYDVKISDEVLGLDLNSSDQEKDQGLFNIETTKKVELDNKGILKFKNVRIKYKGQKFEDMGLNKKVDEFFAMPPNSNKYQKEQLKSMKVKLTPDSYIHNTGNENLEDSWTSTGQVKNHQFSYLSENTPETTKHDLPTYENDEKVYKKGMGLQQNTEYSFSDKRQIPLLKEIPKNRLLQETNEDEDDMQKKYVNPKFRGGRKLLQFTETDNDKLVENRDGILLSIRNQRSLKNLPENNWCTLPRDIYFGKLDCTVWSYQKVCVVTCTKNSKVQGSNQAEHICTRKRNVWEPKFEHCEDEQRDKDFAALDATTEKMKSTYSEDDDEDLTLPSYEYITGDEEFDEYVYKYEEIPKPSKKKSSKKKHKPK